MEIKFKQGDRIAIPEGCTAVINNGAVVFEKEEYEFKDGDIIAKSDAVAILKGDFKNGIFRDYACLNFDGKVLISNNTEWSTMPVGWHIATEVEKQRLFDKMKEQGFRWNAEKKQVEKVRWKPEVDEDYFYVNFYGNVVQTRNIGGYGDYELQKAYNYFPTREQAKKASEAINETLRRFHEENE